MMRRNTLYLIGIFMIVSMNLMAGTKHIELDKNVLQAPAARMYQWYYKGEIITGANTAKVRAMSNGLYTVKFETEDGRILTETVNVNLSTGKIQRIHLVGDSTMADYSLRSNYMEAYYPVTGWGQVFQQFMHSDSLSRINHFINADSIKVIDWAIGGRSTRVFYEEGSWNKVYNAIQPGDYVMIQFGHNDASVNHPDRYVDTAGFKMYLKLFAQQTREKGGIPVFITPVNRNYPWSGGVLSSVHGDYTPAMILAADESNTALIDLTARSCEFFTSKGQDFVTDNYFNNCDPGEYPAYPDGNSDGTHFNPEGAVEVARLVYQGLQDLRQLTITMNDEAAGRIAGSRWHDTKYTSNMHIPVFPNRGWVFENWSGDISSSDNPLVLDFNATTNIAANFRATTKNQYNVSTSVDGSGIINISPFGGLYEEGSTVSLQASPATGKLFYSWTGDHIDTINPLGFDISEDTEMMGVFVENTATVYQPERATLTSCQLNSDSYNRTGSSCIKVEKDSENRVGWTVIPEKENYLKFYLRYSNVMDSTATVNLYVNNVLERENVKLPVSGPAGSWSTIRIGAERLSYAEHTVSFECQNLSGDIYIDFIKIIGSVPLLDTWVSTDKTEMKNLNMKIVPNPVFSSAIISFNLEQSSNTSIEIFNLNGQKQYSVFSGSLHAGSHEISLDQLALKKGLYFCSVTTNQGSTTRKFIME